MRRKILFIAAVAVFSIYQQTAATETSKTSNINILVQNVLSTEFYVDEKVVYSDVVPFTNVDPNKSMVYADGRLENDGKSDTGIVCKSNAGVNWQFKLHAIPTPPLTADKLKYYVSQPYNRNTGGLADGTLARSAWWYAFSSTPTTIYSSGFHDTSNLPFGTLITFNFALDPSGLNAGQAYSLAVIYTFTTTP